MKKMGEINGKKLFAFCPRRREIFSQNTMGIPCLKIKKYNRKKIKLRVRFLGSWDSK